MKRIKIFTCAVFAFFLVYTAKGQDNSPVYSPDSIYSATKVAHNVWQIMEKRTVNIYVVEGKDSALIIDTGYGNGNLKSFIQKLTNLPLVVVNTHGHGDHIGGDVQFSKIYLHPEDFKMVVPGFKKDKPAPSLVPVKEGYVFNLGGRKLEVMEVPGHTHGSIVLFDVANKILFAGDNTNGIVWLFLKDCYPLEVYLQSLEKVQKRLNDFDIIMPGHNEPLVKTFINEQIACVKSILDGTCKPEPYNYSDFTKGAMVCKYQTSEVAYDPNNLRIKK